MQQNSSMISALCISHEPPRSPSIGQWKTHIGPSAQIRSSTEKACFVLSSVPCRNRKLERCVRFREPQQPRSLADWRLRLHWKIIGLQNAPPPPPTPFIPWPLSSLCAPLPIAIHWRGIKKNGLPCKSFSWATYFWDLDLNAFMYGWAERSVLLC